MDGKKCNLCGKSFAPLMEHLHFVHKISYGSPRDGDTDTWDICQDCYEAIRAECKVPVATVTCD